MAAVIQMTTVYRWGDTSTTTFDLTNEFSIKDLARNVANYEAKQMGPEVVSVRFHHIKHIDVQDIKEELEIAQRERDAWKARKH